MNTRDGVGLRCGLDIPEREMMYGNAPGVVNLCVSREGLVASASKLRTQFFGGRTLLDRNQCVSFQLSWTYIVEKWFLGRADELA